MAHISLAREAGGKLVVAGFDPRVRLDRPVVQWTGRLRPKEQARVRFAPGRPMVLTLWTGNGEPGRDTTARSA